MITSRKCCACKNRIFRRENSKYFYQFLLGLSVTFYHFAAAIPFAWASPSIPKLKSIDSPIPITSDEGSWIITCLNFGAFVAPIPAAWMMDKIGRKKALFIGIVPLLFGYILLTLADAVYQLMLYMFLAGIGWAVSNVVAPMYLAEIASDNIRGFLCILYVIMGKVGLLYGYAVGPFVSIKLMAWLATVPGFIFLFTFMWFPESPYYLLGENKRDEAMKSLIQLRCTEEVQEEFETMELLVKKSQQHQGTFKELFLTRGNRKSLIIVLGLSAVLCLCGSQLILMYAQTIFQKVDIQIQPAALPILCGIVQLVSAIFASLAVDSIGRRPLLHVSIVGTAIFNTIIAVYFCLQRYQFDLSGIAWLPVMSIMAVLATYTIGILSVLVALVAELFPKHLKAIVSSVVSMYYSAFGLVTVKLFQIVWDGLGADFVFFGFALFTYAFIPFVWFLVPETKCKSLNLILDEMDGNVDDELK